MEVRRGGEAKLHHRYYVPTAGAWPDRSLLELSGRLEHFQPAH